MVPLELILLGRPQLRMDGRDLTPDMGAKGFALLALLVRVAPAPMPRERLAGALWSDKREEAARYRLRHSLWDLRRMVGGDVIQSDQNACWLDLRMNVKIDLIEFQRGCNQFGIGTPQPKATAGDAPALSDVAALDQGELLSDLTLREAPVFEEWLLAERERLQLLCQDVLWNLARAQQAANASSEAAETLARLISIDPLRERNYLALMAVYLATINVGASNTPKAVVVADALWCGTCKPQAASRAGAHTGHLLTPTLGFFPRARSPLTTGAIGQKEPCGGKIL